MPSKIRSFRVGKVQGYLRGKIWYLCYHEQGKRRRPRVGADKEAAKQFAGQVNAQLQVGAPAALSFEPVSIPALRERWLKHHEEVLRSSVQTIRRYRSATDHLLRFLQTRPVRQASHFQVGHAEDFVRYLRTVKVSPNGHANTARRCLLDKGLCYILECCRTLFQFAAKRRHLPPYAENPFTALEIGRIPVETGRPIQLLTPDQERAFLEACDDWQFPLFLTLVLTGLRPGELTHLLVTDIDFENRILRVRNKPKLGWQIKTRNERDIPLLPALANVLQVHLDDRQFGPVFVRRLWSQTTQAKGDLHALQASMENQLGIRARQQADQFGRPLTREELLRGARRYWREIGAVKEDRVRVEFMRLMNEVGLAACTAPKVLRHQFATALQEGRVDPLIRNELMGHVAPGDKTAGHGLAMTAVYTHTRPETRRQQLEAALKDRPAALVAEAWLRRKRDAILQADSHVMVEQQQLAG